MPALALLVAAVALAATALGDPGGSADASGYPAREVQLMAPADPGGGWDTTARSMQKALKDSRAVSEPVQVFNVGGAGGTIGLSQMASRYRRDPYTLMVMGLVMVGAIETNDAPVKLSEITPIASLTTEPEAIVVPAGSPWRSIEDLVATLKRDPRSVSFAGGSAGGTDQILVGQIAQAVGVDPAETKYVAYSGGGEANSAILSGSVKAGVSSLSEFTSQLESGKMRLLAVSSPDPVRFGGKQAPLLTDAGIDVTLTNWRGLMGAADLTDAQAEGITRMVERLHASSQWREQMKRNGWTDAFRVREEFARFLRSEDQKATAVLQKIQSGAGSG